MAETTPAAASTDRTPAGPRDRLAAVCAVAFGVLFVAGMFMSGFDTEQSDAAVADDFHDMRAVMFASMYVLALAGFAFMVVASTLIGRVRAGLTERSELIARGTSLLFVGLLFVGGAAFAALAGGDLFGSDEMGSPSVDLIRWLPNIGFATVLGFGALSAALFIAVVSRAGRASAALPNWFSVLGYVTAVVLLFAVFFIPAAILVIWAIAAAVVLSRPAHA